MIATSRVRGDGRCPVHGTPLAVGTDRLGRVLEACPACARHRAGICLDCPRRISGRAWRCRECGARAQKAAGARSEARNRERRRAAERTRYAQLSPEARAEKLARKKAWRDQHPMKVMLQKRRARLAGRGGYRSREDYLAYQRKANDKRRLAKREYMRQKAKWFGQDPVCRDCGAPVAWSRVGRPPLRCQAHRVHPSAMADQPGRAA